MDEVQLTAGDALLVVDVQNDFLPGGRLAVPQGDEVLPVLNACLQLFTARGLPVFVTRDWHPADHCSFHESGGIWPPHCIADSPGADFPPGLRLPSELTLISKATQREEEAYSGFAHTDLALRLRQSASTRLFIGGLATDYCVLSTVRDALAEGFGVVLLVDATRAVNVEPDDGERAVAQMCALGARLATFDELA